MPYMVEQIVHCHVLLVLLVADSAYHNAVGGGLLRFIEVHVIHTVRYSLIVLFLFCLEQNLNAVQGKFPSI